MRCSWCISRQAPSATHQWIALRTRDGLAYFANLLTRETRWLPPHLWMHGWVSRLDVESASALAAADDRLMSRALGTAGRELPCDGRKPLPPLLGRQRVEGGGSVHVRAVPGRAAVPAR